MSGENQLDIEAAAEAQAEAEAELKELESVEIGLDNEAIMQIAAKKRFDFAQYYTSLKMDLGLAKASAKANESLNNKQAADQLFQKLPLITVEMQHCLRSIRQIDKEFPSALERMKKLVALNIKMNELNK